MSDALFDRWPEAERILDEVLDLEAGERRRRAVAACRGDEALRGLVEQLLDADTAPEGLPAEPAGVVADLPLDDDVPDRVGPFCVERELGRGGMGRVLLGRRDDDGGSSPAVALKLLDVVAPSSVAWKRFARERATLARLRHPHIARLSDAGVDEAGTPYLVMEYVEGSPIDGHCDAQAAGLEARLALFHQVCLAVEYAHSQFIVHRDLKPANVLVDTFGQVKLLDFGIAKWLDALDEDGALTQTLHRALTPGHAAPEQFRGEPITTATDVYQLGLLLYRMLTGRPAHGEWADSPEQLRSSALDVDPERPSRATRVATFATRLEGDLDAIVLKALRKEPAERYATVEALRTDLDNYLAYRPVAARRGTTTYVLRKYLRRHRVAASAVMAVLVSSTLGLAAVAHQSRLIAAERDRAKAAEAKASAINAFLVNDLLVAATPERSRGTIPTVDVVLDMAARSVGQAFEDQPSVGAEVRLTLARSYASLGKFAEASEHAAAAVTILSRDAAGDRLGALRARSFVAELGIEEGRYAEARSELEALLAEQQAIGGATDVDTLRTRGLLSRALRRLGEPMTAEQESRQVVALADEAHPADRRLGIELRTILVEALNAQVKSREAEAVIDEVVALAREQYGEAHPRTIDALGVRAAVLTSALKYREAIDAQRELVALSERVYGAEHAATGRAFMGLAVALSRVYGNAGDESYEPIARAYDILRRSLGEDHPETLQALRNLGIWHRYKGNLVEAERITRTVLDARRRTLGEHHRGTLEAARSVASVLSDAGRADEARRMGRQIVRAFEEATTRADADPLLLDDFAVYLIEGVPEDVRDRRRALEYAQRAVVATGRSDHLRLRTLAQAQLANGMTEAAMTSLHEALALPDGLVSWTQERMLASLMREHSSPAELERWLLERLAQYPRHGRADDFAVARTLRHLADLYVREGRLDEAERRLTEALAQMRKSVDDSHFEVAEVKLTLGEVLGARGATPEAERLLVEGFESLLSDYRVRAPTRARFRDRVVAAFEQWGRAADAKRWKERPLE